MEWVKNVGDIDEAISNMMARLINEIEDFQDRGSGYRWEASIMLEIKVMKKERGVARTRKAGYYVKTPSWIRERKAVINMKPPQEHDNKCFAWVLLRARYPLRKGAGGIQHQSISDLVSKLHEVKLPNGIQYPIPLHSEVFHAIEQANPWCSFSVFHLSKKKDIIRQVYVSLLRRSRPLHVQIGALTDPKDANKIHFILITRMKALLGGKHKDKQDVCEKCLTLHDPLLIEQHERDCWSHHPTRIIMPLPEDKDQKLIFRQWQYRLAAPFVIYADFECLLRAPQGQQGDMDGSTLIHCHEPFGFAYSIQCSYSYHQQIVSPALDKPLGQVRVYIGPKAAQIFLSWIWEEVKFLRELVNQLARAYQPAPIDQKLFHEATHCHICLRPFAGNDEKVLDHDHFTGAYRGAAHRTCNSKYTTWKKRYSVPIVFHNLRGYDSYIIIRGVKDLLPKEVTIDPIAKSIEKYTSFTIQMKDPETRQLKVSMRFIDSLQFMQGNFNRYCFFTHIHTIV